MKNYDADGTPVVNTKGACLRKKRFENEAKTWSAIFTMRARGQDTERLMPYECEHCSSWHLGRLPARMRSTLRPVRNVLGPHDA